MTALTAKSLDLSRVRRRRLSGLLPKSRLALLVIVIVFIFYGIMLWYPILDQFDMAFHRGLTLRRVPVGGMQFQRVLQDRAFNNAIGVTLRYVLMVVPATTILGLLLAAELSEDARAGRSAKDVASACLDGGLVVNGVTPTALRLAPPFVVSAEQLAEGCSILAGVLEHA